jgi:hypothetical protein
MPNFGQSQRWAQILILKILNVFLWLKFSPALTLTKIRHSDKASIAGSAMNVARISDFLQMPGGWNGGTPGCNFYRNCVPIPGDLALGQTPTIRIDTDIRHKYDISINPASNFFPQNIPVHA